MYVCILQCQTNAYLKKKTQKTSVDLQKKTCFAFCLQHSAKSDALFSPLQGESGKIYVCETSKVFHFSLESSLPY